MTRISTYLLFAALAGVGSESHAQIAGCSASENQIIADQMPKAMEAVLQLDLGRYQSLLGAMIGSLSERCQTAFAYQLQQQQQQQQQWRQPSPYRGGGSIERGSDGTLYGPGVACPPSGGCIPMN